MKDGRSMRLIANNKDPADAWQLMHGPLKKRVAGPAGETRRAGRMEEPMGKVLKPCLT